MRCRTLFPHDFLLVFVLKEFNKKTRNKAELIVEVKLKTLLFMKMPRQGCGAIFLTLKSVACPFGILYCQMKDTTPWDFQADTVTQGGLGLIWQKVLLTLHRDSSFFFLRRRGCYIPQKSRRK